LFNDLLGKTFKYGGRGEDEYDCWGLCMEVMKRVGKQLPDYGFATDARDIHTMIQKYSGNFEEIQHPEPYCLVAFYIRYPYVSHIGVMLDPPYFIHILEKSNVTIERIDTPLWVKRVAGFYRWKG